jgi:hypothetical protein
MTKRMTNVIKRVALGALGAAATSVAVAKVRARRKHKAAATAATNGNGVKVTKAPPKAATMPGTTESVEAAERTKARRAGKGIAQKARERKGQARNANDPRLTHRHTHRA